MRLRRELAYRIRRRFRSKITKLRYRAGLDTLEPGVVRISAEFRHPIDHANREALISRYRASFATSAQREVEEAERLLRHEFRLLGHEMHHGAHIRWSRDPVSGKDWRRTFSAEIPYRGPERLGDIKLPWELNKHQYFFTLGKATWLTGDAKFAKEIVAQIDHWIRDNPCHAGIHWISALETGTRVLSWVLAYPFFAEYCDSATHRRLARSIAQHLLFVEQNLSVGEFSNTHLAGEAAILVAGALFLDCEHCPRWLATGLHHLESEIFRQVRSDAVHSEQSIAYHRFFLDQYYLVNALLLANGRALSPSTLDRMQRMTQFLLDLLHPDGSVPLFGDCDDARAIWCRADAPLEYRSLLALGAVSFKRTDFKMIAREPAEELLWLHGEHALQEFSELRSELPDHSSIDYRDAGYYIMRTGWSSNDAMLVVDCGPLGHGPAGHGHADALSFQLFAHGYAFLIDPGTYSYNLDYEWRDRFRGTAAHNTLSVDGLDQSLVRDRMSWATHAQSRCNRWLTTAWFDLIDGQHDGYERLEHPLTHRRVIAFIKPDVWVICDQLTGDGTHRFELALHLPPDCTVDGVSKALAVSSPAGNSLRVRIDGDDTRADHQENLMWTINEDWYSGTYGKRVQSRTLRASGIAHGNRTVVTCLTTSSDVAMHVEVIEGALKISTKRANTPEKTLIYRLEGSGSIRSDNNLEFDGNTLFQIGTADGTELLWSCAVHAIVVRDHVEMSSVVPVDSLTFDCGHFELKCSNGNDKDLILKIPDRFRSTILRE